jgi:phage tail sheath protein FI
MKFTKATLVASAAAMSLGLAACDGANENAMEDAGEQQAEEVNDIADQMEAEGAITSDQEDAMVDEAEDTADAMEEQGEMMDEGAEGAAEPM